MGNRAVITHKEEEWGLYTHSLGDRATVEGFLNYANMMYHELGPKGQVLYLQEIMSPCTTGELKVNRYQRLDRDNGENGVYIINSDWEIIGRKYIPDPIESEAYNLLEIMKTIDEKQKSPVGEQKIREYLRNRK